MTTEPGNSGNTVAGRGHAAAHRPPSARAGRLIRYIVGFGVGVAVGLAPYLGLLEVPGFKALLTLIPNEMQDRVIPLSATVMGVVAVSVQWYGWDKVTERRLLKWFRRALIYLLLALCAFIVIQRFTVLKVPIRSGKDYISLLVGFERRPHPRCPLEISTLECVRNNTADPAFLASLYGDRQLNLADLLLTFSYLAVTGLFGVLVGLVMLKEQGRGGRNRGRGRVGVRRAHADDRQAHRAAEAVTAGSATSSGPRRRSRGG